MKPMDFEGVPVLCKLGLGFHLSRWMIFDELVSFTTSETGGEELSSDLAHSKCFWMGHGNHS